MANEEGILRQLVAELQALEGTAEALQSRLNLVNAALTELKMANTTLEGVEAEKKGTSVFVPIGGESYVKGKLERVDQVIVGIGAGIAIEKTIDEAKDHLGKRTANMEKTREALRQQLTQVIAKIQEGRSKLQELTTKVRGGERSTIV